jgi:predicted DNA-binding ribbon-helix-helix protein
MSRRERRPHRKSRLKRRTVVIAGNKTSVSLEDTFWQSLKEIAGERDMTLSKLITTVKSERRHGNIVGHSPVRARFLSAANCCQQVPPWRAMIAKTGFDFGPA